MFDWVENRVLVKAFKYWAHSVCSLQIKPKKYSSRKKFDIFFDKAKGRRRTVNRASVYAEAAVRRVLKKRCYEKFFKILKKTSVLGSLFGVFSWILRNFH